MKPSYAQIKQSTVLNIKLIRSVSLLNNSNFRIYSPPNHQAAGWTVGIRFPVGTKDFSLLHSIQTRSGGYPASYPMDAVASFPRDKSPERESGHSPASNAEVENHRTIYTSTSLYVFIA
jgi:hypothetical protein